MRIRADATRDLYSQPREGAAGRVDAQSVASSERRSAAAAAVLWRAARSSSKQGSPLRSER